MLTCAGAGGHAGTLSPFALVGEIRKFYDGPIALSGSIANGRAILAAQAMGADFAYIGTRVIATKEANAIDAYKQGIVDAAASDIVYTPYFTGIRGNYIRASIERAGLDPDMLAAPVDPTKQPFDPGKALAKAWRDVWSAGQGVGTIHDVPTVAELVRRLTLEYEEARQLP